MTHSCMCGGIGMRFNPMFRSDTTVDGINRLDITGTNGKAPGVTSSGHVSSVVGLLNGYFDLNGAWPNTFGRFQPYIDFGIGVRAKRSGPHIVCFERHVRWLGRWP